VSGRVDGCHSRMSLHAMGNIRAANGLDRSTAECIVSGSYWSEGILLACSVDVEACWQARQVESFVVGVVRGGLHRTEAELIVSGGSRSAE
jgi:hypothetical protein